MKSDHPILTDVITQVIDDATHFHDALRVFNDWLEKFDLFVDTSHLTDGYWSVVLTGGGNIRTLEEFPTFGQALNFALNEAIKYGLASKP